MGGGGVFSPPLNNSPLHLLCSRLPASPFFLRLSFFSPPLLLPAFSFVPISLHGPSSAPLFLLAGARGRSCQRRAHSHSHDPGCAHATRTLAQLRQPPIRGCARRQLRLHGVRTECAPGRLLLLGVPLREGPRNHVSLLRLQRLGQGVRDAWLVNTRSFIRGLLSYVPARLWAPECVF